MAVRFVILKNRIPALMAFVEAESRMAVMRNAKLIASSARRRAPRDTGELQGSIEAVSESVGKSARIEVGAEHGPYVEYGTYKMAAQPFLAPAVQEFTSQFFDDVGKGMFAKF